MTVLLLLLAISVARAEFCATKPDTSIPDTVDTHWRSQLVDGHKCWYRSDRKLPNEDLIWSYNSKEFDEEGKVTDRKFFTPDELKR
jgi:hypothetical protein